MRCIYSCEKTATGALDRGAMLKDLQQKAADAPDKEEQVQFVPGTLRGKKVGELIRMRVPAKCTTRYLQFIPPIEEAAAEDIAFEQKMTEGEHNDEVSEEQAEFFAHASMLDLQEMADILGVTYQDHCRATELPAFPPAPPNDVDAADIVRRVAANDPDLVDVNLNNVRGVEWARLLAGLAGNGHVESVSAANCDITDSVGALICDCLERNGCLRLLTLDSNSLSGDMVVRLIAATAARQTVEELRLTNQVGVSNTDSFECISSLSSSSDELQVPRQPRRVGDRDDAGAHAAAGEAGPDHGVPRHAQPDGRAAAEEPRPK